MSSKHTHGSRVSQRDSSHSPRTGSSGVTAPKTSSSQTTASPLDSTLSASSETLVASSLERAQNATSLPHERISSQAIRVSSRERPSTSGQSPRSQPSAIGLLSFTRMFSGGRNEAKRESLVTNEGSIAQTAWKSIGKGSSRKDRERTLLQLQEMSSGRQFTNSSTTASGILGPMLTVKKDKHLMMKNKNLQVSTLEGIYHETVDMLDDVETRESTLKAYIEMTKTQYKQIGLALRETIFKKIKLLGCSGLTVEWLVALSNNGANLSGFEKDMDFLMADWIKLGLEGPQQEVKRVLSIIHNMILSNSSYIAEESLKTILRSCACYSVRHFDNVTKFCVQVMEASVKFSEIPSTELHSIIVAICHVMASEGGDKLDTDAIRNEAWSVARGLLTSNLGHRTRKYLHEILQLNPLFDRTKSRYDLKTLLRMIRGAVLCLAMAYWGNQQIENVRTPAAILPSMQIAIRADATVCRDVLSSLRRLFEKYGRDLQEMAWRAVIQLMEEADSLCRKSAAYEDLCRQLIHSVVDIIQQYYCDGQLSCPDRYLFDLIERFGDKKSDTAVLKLIEYRVSTIEVHSDKWAQELKECVEKYLTYDSNLTPEMNYTRREKALTVFHEFFNTHRLLVENELVTKVMLPVFMNAHKETNHKIQYHMINILFDAAKNISFRGDTFEQIFRLIRRLFNEGLLGLEQGQERRQSRVSAPVFSVPSKSSNGSTMAPSASASALLGGVAISSNDNLEIMAQEIAELMTERWQQLSAPSLKEFIDTFVEHVNRQYDLNLTGEDGGDVRVRIYDAVLSIQCCPVTKRIRHSRAFEDEPVINPLVFRKGVQGRPRGSGEIAFTEIAQIVARALRMETWWPTLRVILHNLQEVLEATSYVKTAPKEMLDDLFASITPLFERITGERQVPDKEICKYLAPVLVIALNYDLTSNQQREICKILVELVKLSPDNKEALMACDLAVQIVPNSMAIFSHQLLLLLREKQPFGSATLPVLELMSDASGIDSFHNLFQEEQFRSVADILLPYINVKPYNVFVVSCVHRILMRWYSKVPKELRPEISRYYEKKFQDLLSAIASQASQQSGIPRQANIESSTSFVSTASETPPAIGSVNARTTTDKQTQQNILEEIQIALQQFYRLGRIEPMTLGSPSDMENFEELESEHYSVGQSILTLRVLAEKGKLKNIVEDDDVFSEKSGFLPQNGCYGTNDERRRYASAIQPPTRRQTMSKGEPPKALDDLSLTKQRTASMASTSAVPVVTVIQLIDRHMYGRANFLWRRLEDMPEDFLNYKESTSSFSPLSLHLSALPGSMRIGAKKSADMVAIRLRNLDRISGIEMHAVGVVYMGYGQETNAQILCNQYGSPKYEAFIKTLGTAQSTDDEPGGLQADKNGEYTYVFNDETSNIVFLVATLMPRLNSDPRCNNKKMLIGNNVVCIMWNQSGKGYEIGSFCGDFIHVMIEIIPIDEHSLLIKVHARKEISCFLAMRQALVPYSAAPAIIRKLCVRAKLAVEVHRTTSDSKEIPYISSAIERLRKIQALKEM